MPEPITDDQDETITLPSGKKAVVPPPAGTSSPMYNADPSDGSGKDDPTSSFLKRFDPAATKGLTDNLAGIERQRGEALEKSSGELNSRMEHDRAQMERAFGAEAASANSIPPAWNADKERQDRISDPIANFGSIGSIFALVASAFTKTPMTSALNGAAAAMQAIHDHDEEGYKSAYQAWKDNTELAIKRFGMEREMFEDTNKLLDTDVNAWKVQTLAQAAQFDNKKVIAMLDAGMDPDIINMQASQVRGLTELIEAKEKIEDFNTKHGMVQALFKQNDEALPEAPKVSGATPQQQKEADQKYYKENPGALPQWKALYRGYATIKARGGMTVPESIINDARMEAAAQGKVLSSEEEAELVQKSSRVGGGGAPTKNKEIYRRWQTAVQAHPEWNEDQKAEAYDKISQDVANASQPTMTPKTRIDTESSVDQYKEAQTKIDATIKSLETHAGEAGLAGKATRMGEVVGNIFGNNDTDRKQFMRDIQFLRTGAQKLLFDRSGRPLAADADRINDIIGGLSLGDTTANTLRSLREVQKVLNRLEQQKEKQLGGKWQPDNPGTPGGTPDSGTKPAWEEAPIVGQ